MYAVGLTIPISRRCQALGEMIHCVERVSDVLVSSYAA